MKIKKKNESERTSGNIPTTAHKQAKDITLRAPKWMINDRPDGYNINLNCGALYPESLGQTVVKEKADIGIALDGDADRLVVCDENGSVVDGDQLIATIAVLLLNQKKLKLYMERKASCDQSLQGVLQI